MAQDTLMHTVTFVALAALVGCTLLPGGTRKVRLAENGTALADIVVAADADKAARFGAADLAWHLKEITGAEFRIITDAEPKMRFEICVGPSRRAKHTAEGLDEQECRIDIRADGIDLIGRDKPDKTSFVYTNDVNGVLGRDWPDMWDAQGSMYAVYEFLENIVGVKWLDPTDYGILLPHEPSLAVPIGTRRQQPFIFARGGTWSGGSYHVLMWKGQDENAKRYHALGYGGRDARRIHNQQRLFLARHRAGGLKRSANHSFYHFYDYYWKKDSKQFREFRPDFFSVGTSDAALPAQLCYENPEVIARVIAEVRAYFDDPDPTKKRWGEDSYCLEPMDNSSFCRCDKCRPQYEPERAKDSSAHSTYWFRFVNKVAREIKKSHPGKMISTLAYMSHEGLPTGFDLEDNVIVWFCLFNNRMPFKKGYQRQFERMAEWRERYPERPLGLWLYNTFPLETAQNANFKTFPGYFSRKAVEQYQFLKRINARAGIVECGINGALESYMQLELLQNPDRTADELLNEYYSMFGKAAPAMRKFHDLCEKRYCDPAIRPPQINGTSQEASWKYVGTPEVMKELAGYIAEADRLADTPQAKGALELFKTDMWEYMQQGCEAYWLRADTPYPRYEAVRIPDAGGDIARVAWTQIPATNQPLYAAGTETPSAFSSAVRAAHDGSFLYLEITQHLDTSKLKPCAAISYWDDIEIMFARTRSMPYRCWFVAPDGRFYAASFGEVNFRWHVVPGDNYRSTYASDITAPDKWVNRLAIPLDGLAAEPFQPGDTLYMNAASTLGPHFSGPGTRFGVYTLTSFTYVHVPDRMASIHLAP